MQLTKSQNIDTLQHCVSIIQPDEKRPDPTQDETEGIKMIKVLECDLMPEIKAKDLDILLK
jgi:hypothetical protein